MFWSIASTILFIKILVTNIIRKNGCVLFVFYQLPMTFLSERNIKSHSACVDVPKKFVNLCDFSSGETMYGFSM